MPFSSTYPSEVKDEVLKQVRELMQPDGDGKRMSLHRAAGKVSVQFSGRPGQAAIEGWFKDDAGKSNGKAVSLTNGASPAPGKSVAKPPGKSVTKAKTRTPDIKAVEDSRVFIDAVEMTEFAQANADLRGDLAKKCDELDKALAELALLRPLAAYYTSRPLSPEQLSP